MTMRGAINEMLAGLGLGTDPAEVLAEYGFSDVPPDAIASALVHYAEAADLDLADALAPIVTRVSDVPFEEGDLPPIESDPSLGQSADLFELLNEVGLGGRDLAAVVDDDADLDGFDDFDTDELGDVFGELTGATAGEDAAGEAEAEDDTESGSTYGSGTELNDELANDHGDHGASPDADTDTNDASDGSGGDYDGDYDGAVPTELDLGQVDDVLPEELESTYEELTDHGHSHDYDYDEGFDDTDPSDLDLE